MKLFVGSFQVGSFQVGFFHIAWPYLPHWTLPQSGVMHKLLSPSPRAPSSPPSQLMACFDLPLSPCCMSKEDP